MAVGVEARGAAWSASAPTKLFEGRYVTASGSAARMYDVSPDGERFVMVKQAADSGAASPQIVIVQNWHEELKRLVPTTR